MLELTVTKRKGEEVVPTTEEPTSAEVVDSMAALQQSVERSRSGIDAEGRSSMTEDDLAEAIRAANTARRAS